MSLPPNPRPDPRTSVIPSPPMSFEMLSDGKMPQPPPSTRTPRPQPVPSAEDPKTGAEMNAAQVFNAGHLFGHFLCDQIPKRGDSAATCRTKSAQDPLTLKLAAYAAMMRSGLPGSLDQIWRDDVKYETARGNYKDAIGIHDLFAEPFEHEEPQNS